MKRERWREHTDVPYSVSLIPYHMSVDTMSTRANIQTVLYMLHEIAVFIENGFSRIINGLTLLKVGL